MAEKLAKVGILVKTCLERLAILVESCLVAHRPVKEGLRAKTCIVRLEMPVNNCSAVVDNLVKAERRVKIGL